MSLLPEELKQQNAPQPPAPQNGAARPVLANEQETPRVSLIPPLPKGGEHPSRSLVVPIAVILALVISGVSYVLARVTAEGRRSEAAAWNARIDAAKRDARTAEADVQKSQALRRQVQVLRKVLDTHTAWSRFFDFLETSTHKEVAFTQFTSGGEGSVTLQAEATSYRAVAEQMSVFARSPLIKEAKVSGLISDIDPRGQLKAVRFTVSLQFDPSRIAFSAP